MSDGRPTALALTEYLLLSNRTRQVFDTEPEAHGTVEAAAIGNELRPLLLDTSPDRLVGPLGMACALVQAMHLSMEPGIQFVVRLDLSRGVKKRSRTSPTWFST